MKINTQPNIPKKDELERFELTHRHAGNGYYMVEDIDRDYCRVTPFDKTRAFLAAKNRLSVYKKKNEATGIEEAVQIPEDMLYKLQVLRNEIKIGHKIVRETRIVNRHDP